MTTTSSQAVISSAAAQLAPIIDLIWADVQAANGRRRQRTLSRYNVERALIEALTTGSAYRNGGTVANKYGYPAVQTVLLVGVSPNGKISWQTHAANATKGCTGVGRRDQACRSIIERAAAEGQTLALSDYDFAVAADALEEAGDADQSATYRAIAEAVAKWVVEPTAE